MSDKLPNGWVTAALAQLTENPKQDIISGPFGSNLKSDEYVSEGVPIIRLQNVDRNRFLEKNMRFITPQKGRELSAHNFRAGDVVITKLGDPLGKACAIPESLPHGIVVADVVRVRIDESRFYRSYVLFAINSPAVVNQINSEMMGSTRPRVNLNNIRDLQIPVAPLPEQRRIVAKLETLLGKVDACQQRLAKIPKLIKRFRHSVLAAACSGRLTADWREENPNTEPVQLGAQSDELPNSWRECPLSEVVQVSSGEAFKKSEYSESGARLLQIANVSFGKIIWEQQNFLPLTYLKSHSDLVLQDGDILMALNRPLLNWRIKVARITKPDLPAILYQRVGRFLFIGGDRSVNADYLFQFLQSFGFIRELSERLRGTDQPYVNPPEMLEILFPCAPLAEQQEIVRRVEVLFALAGQIEARFTQARAQVGKLTPSLLARAFRGELVPQDPNDEPASALLERIRQTKTNDQPKRKIKRAALATI